MFKIEPHDKNVKYYGTGSVRTVGGWIYSIINDKYVYEFFRDNEDLIRSENEISEEQALEHYLKYHGSEDMFYKCYSYPSEED